MAKRKAKSRRTDTAQPGHKDTKPYDIDTKAGFFPFARYTSVLGVHTTLLAFSALFLPRTVFFITTPDLTPASSRDKPQHHFLNALTINPAWTLACICGGAIILQGWWGGWMRNWSNEFTLKGSDDEKRLGRSILDQRKYVVSLLRHTFCIRGVFSTQEIKMRLAPQKCMVSYPRYVYNFPYCSGSVWSSNH
jgi:GPI ethanolamine phosphate transferase 2/3 subunit F